MIQISAKNAVVAQRFAGSEHWLRQVSMNFGRSGHWLHLYLSIGAIIHSLVHMVFWYAQCVQCFGNMYMVLRQEWKWLGKNCDADHISLSTAADSREGNMLPMLVSEACFKSHLSPTSLIPTSHMWYIYIYEVAKPLWITDDQKSGHAHKLVLLWSRSKLYSESLCPSQPH